MRESTGESNSGSKAAPDLQMKGFPLGFRDAGVEAEYRRKWLRATRRDHILWTSASTIGYGLISGLIWIAAEPGFVEFQWFRLFVAFPLLVVAMAIVVCGRFREEVYFPLFVLKTLAVYGNAIISYAVADAADFRMYLFESALLFVFIQCFYPARWAMATVFTFIATSIAIAAAIHADAGPAGQEVPLEMFLLVTLGLAATGNFAAFSKEVLSRRNFRQIVLLTDRRRRSDELARDASRAAEAKARFLAIAAHELRTPLNALQGFTELVRLTQDQSEPSTELYERFFAIERDASHLAQLAETVLTISQDGYCALSDKRQFFEIEALLEDVASQFASVARDFKVTTMMDKNQPSHVVRGDPDVYRTLLDCLVRRVHAQSGFHDEMLLKFTHEDHATFVLSVHSDRAAVDGNENQAESVVVDFSKRVHVPAHRSPNSLMDVLAETQGVLFRQEESVEKRPRYNLEVPAELVAPVSPVSSERRTRIRRS